MIEEIAVSGFKSIGDVRVQLSPTTVLIGRSGSGKSNFLRAIRFLRNYLVGGDHAVAAEGGWQRIWPFGSPQPLEISVSFRLPGFDDRFRYSVGWAPRHRQMTTQHERLEVGSRVVFARSAAKWEVWPGTGGPAAAANHATWLGQFPTVTEAVLAFAAWTSGVGWHDFPAGVLTTSAPAQPLFRNGGGTGVRGLTDDADNYLQIMQELTQDVRNQLSRRQVLARLRQINSSVSSVELDSVLKPTAAVVGHDVGGSRLPLDLAQESDGFRRFYAHLLALYQTPPKLVLMFEEPENGVYPGALRALAEEFDLASDAGRGQVILTTQSPDLLDGFDADQIRVVGVSPTDQRTFIARLDPDQAAAVRDELLQPGELLTVDMARPATAIAEATPA